MQTNLIARTVLLSTFLTLVIIGGLAYAARTQIISIIESEQRKDESPAPVMAEDGDQIPDLVARANPAVVSVVVTKDVPVYEQYYEQYNPFGGFFGNSFSNPRIRENVTEEREVGGGSGFIVSEDGLIVTNRHVVADEEARYTAVLNDGTSYEVEVLDKDDVLDIAIVKIKSDEADKSFPYLTFGDSSQIRLGQGVVVIGNALAEFRNSISVGVVSGLSRSIMAGDGRGLVEQLDHVIQTDAAVNPGNSGGPMLNLDGEVIGMNVAASLGAENIGFALPSNIVSDVVASVKEYGEIVRPYLGVRYAMINEELMKREELAVDYGALIVHGKNSDETAVVPDSPADRAGLKENDIILSVDGVKLDETDLASILRTKKVDDDIELRVLDDGEEKTVPVTLERAP